MSQKKSGGYSKKVASEIRDWSQRVEPCMRQEGSGSMNYLSRKDAIEKKDQSMLKKQKLSQSGMSY